jgi:hypothetical protein
VEAPQFWHACCPGKERNIHFIKHTRRRIMPKLLSMLIATGFTCAATAALAQNVTSEGDRAQGQEKVMQQKEQGAGQTQQGARERRTQDYERTQTNQSNDTSSAQSNSNTTSSDTAQSSDKQSSKVPKQSMPSVGHPEEGAQTGQFGVKEMDESGQAKGGSQNEAR